MSIVGNIPIKKKHKSENKGANMNKIYFVLLLSLFSISIYATDFSEPVLHRPPTNFDITETDREAPEGFEIVNPAEFGRVDGIYMAWAGWATDTITAIANAVAEEYTVFMLVENLYNHTLAYTHLSTNGVNMDNVVFITDENISNSSIWIRDYFPFFIYEDGSRSLSDFMYMTYPSDEYVVQTISDEFSFPFYGSSMIHHGGNHISDGNGLAFVSDNIYAHNQAWSEEEIATEFNDYLGIDSLIVVQPMAGDGTGHIDMFCKLLSDTLIVVGEYETPEDSYPGDYALLNGLATHLANMQNIDGRPFRVERIPMPPFSYDGWTINYTYTNSLIINDIVLVPIYGFEMDAEALQVYEDLMPGYDIIGIDSAFIIEYWGATHCMTNSHYSQNPLIVLHENEESIPYNSAPQIKFRLNPKFIDSQASVLYKLISETEFTEISAALSGGIWTASLPEVTEDFQYYIEGEAISGASEFYTTLPETAPTEFFTVDVTDVSVDDVLGTHEISLSNYPNPFNPSTIISFNLTTEHTENIKKLSIEIYNVKGQKVNQLRVTNYKLGLNEVVWDASEFSSGIYFCKLNIQNSPAKKMVLMK